MKHEELVRQLRSNADVVYFSNIRRYYERSTVQLIFLAKEGQDIAEIAAMLVEEDRNALDQSVEKGHVKYVVPDPSEAPPEKRAQLVGFSDINDMESVRAIFIEPLYVIQLV